MKLPMKHFGFTNFMLSRKLSYLKCRSKKKTRRSWFVNRPRKCFLTFFPKRHFLGELSFQRLSKWAEKYSRRGSTPLQELWRYVQPQRVWFLKEGIDFSWFWSLFLCCSIDKGIFSRRSHFFIIIDPWIHVEEAICTWANIRELNKTVFREQSISATVT